MKRLLAALAFLPVLILPASALAAPPLVATPEAMVAPKTTVGETSGTQTIELRNDEEGFAKIEAISLSGSDGDQFGFQGSNCGTLNQGEKCQIWISFVPSRAGNMSATVSVQVFERGTVEIPVSGEAVPAELAWNPATADFGLQPVYNNAQHSFQLENAGEAPVGFNNFQFSGPDSGYFWTGESNCWNFPGGMIGPGQSCSVQVSFQPSEVRGYEADLVASGGSGAKAVLPLSGEGGRAELVAESNPFSFGTAGVGGSGSVRTISLTNQGNLPGAFFIAVVAGGDSGSFELLDESCSGFEPIAPGGNCEAQIRFHPQSPGPKEARMALFGEGDGGTMILLEGEGQASQIGLSAGAIDFGALAAGSRSEARTLLVSNDGDTAADVERVVLAGTDPDQFLLAGEECGGETLAPGASCAVRVRFAPDSAGAKRAKLRVSGGFGTLSAALSGTAGPAAATTPAARPAHYAPVQALRPAHRRFGRNSTIRAPRLARSHRAKGGNSGKHLAAGARARR